MEVLGVRRSYRRGNEKRASAKFETGFPLPGFSARERRRSEAATLLRFADTPPECLFFLWFFVALGMRRYATRNEGRSDPALLNHVFPPIMGADKLSWMRRSLAGRSERKLIPPARAGSGQKDRTLYINVLSRPRSCHHRGHMGDNHFVVVAPIPMCRFPAWAASGQKDKLGFVP